MAMLLSSLTLVPINHGSTSSIMIGYAYKSSEDNNHNEGSNNNNNKMKNRSSVNGVHDKGIVGSDLGIDRKQIRRLLQLIQIQIVQTSGQDKATQTINLINSIINLNPNGPLAQSLLYLAKQLAIGNVNSVIEAAIQVAAHVADGGEDIEEIIKQAAAYSQEVLPSQSSPTSSSSSQIPTLQYTNQLIPRIFLVNPITIATTKQSIMAHNNIILQDSLDKLLKEANKYLSQTPSSVVDKTQLPPSGNKHDYLSLSKYWWPDPSKPNGLPYIYHDGRVNPEYYSIPDKANLEHMIDRVKILSLSYFFTGNEQYASKAAEFIRIWFLNSNTYMNPNLDFAQIRKGYSDVNPGGIIDAHNLPEVIDSIGLIQNSPLWTGQDQSGIIGWFEQYLDWLLNSDAGKDQAEHVNNHGTWYNQQIVSIALFLNKTDMARNIIQDYTQKRLEQQIAKDGSQPQEIKRTLGVSYSIFNLVGVFRLAHMAEYVGLDLWNYKTSKGVGLRNALDYLIPYLLDNKDWPYKQIRPLATDDFEDAVDLLYQAAIRYNNGSYIQSYNSIIQEKNISSSIDDNLLYGMTS